MSATIAGHANTAIAQLINVGANVREILIEHEAYDEIDPKVLNNAMFSLFVAMSELQIIVELTNREEVKP